METVRKANIADINQMSSIHAKTWKLAYKGMIPQNYLDNLAEDFWVDSFNKSFRENLSEALVYEIDGHITGCITFGKARIPASCQGDLECRNECSSCTEIYSLYVDPDHWDTKQGYLLTKAALNDLVVRGYTRTYLWVLSSNKRGINFYRRFGFSYNNESAIFTLQGMNLEEKRFSIKLI